MSWTLQPAAPVSGTATMVNVALRRPDGRPATGATLTLEAHMSHPGMAPVTARLEERPSGNYGAQVTLTMGGEWIFVLTGSLADGSRISGEYKVGSVRHGQ